MKIFRLNVIVAGLALFFSCNISFAENCDANKLEVKVAVAYFSGARGVLPWDVFRYFPLDCLNTTNANGSEELQVAIGLLRDCVVSVHSNTLLVTRMTGTTCRSLPNRD